MSGRVNGREEQPPSLRFLDSDSSRSKIIRLREAVTPILANNLLHHFTDHSVTHSDNLCDLVDKIIEPLEGSSNRLSDQELIVLYAACYLHDIGMQYETAGATQVIRGLSLAEQWDQLTEDARRDLLRRHHNRISAELVAGSVGTAKPPIGIQLDDSYSPAQIACLCEAHCVTPETDRYAELMQDVPGIRMRLLSGLLRLADILDESRHRACREKARTLELNLESQTHWWRHFYTRGVEIDPQTKSITICFEFPQDRIDEYQRIIPSLQIPWIEAELEHHRVPFVQTSLGWTLQTKTISVPYSNIEVMPDQVLTEMVKQLRQRQLREEEETRRIAIESFKQARPLIQRRLTAIKEEKRKNSISPDDYIRELAGLSKELWDIGSHRSAWMALCFEFERTYATLSISKRIDVGADLLRMVIDDDDAGSAKSWIPQFITDVESLPPLDRRKQSALRTIAEWFLDVCGYDEAITAFEKAIAHCTESDEAARLEAELFEMHFLQGELNRVIPQPETKS